MSSLTERRFAYHGGLLGRLSRRGTRGTCSSSGRRGKLGLREKTSRRGPLQRSSRLMRFVNQGRSSALKGRSSIARGGNPGKATVFRPEGAFVNSPGWQPREGDACWVLEPRRGDRRVEGFLPPLQGSRGGVGVPFPGLTPRAIDGRPFRAEEPQTDAPSGRKNANGPARRS